ncbi:secretion protein [Lysobacter lacus]|uniref:Secretion protein n=2 Tax=Cognatilysobacter lacus TaxID=1643323 RepID=A0A5D8ZA21_9GAMM|nr:secretion protein [Lysobacter lacus]
MPADAMANPYMHARHAAAPDLDAAAPSLRSEEQQRVNRKALMFLGGIILLLAIMAILVFKGTGTKADAAKPADEQVSIPTLSDSSAPPLPQTRAVAQPIDVQPTQETSLPPLPPQPAYANTMPSAAPGLDPPMQQQGHVPTLLERRTGAQQDPMAAAGGSPPNAYAQAVAMTQAALAGQGGAQKHDDVDGATGDAATRATSARGLRKPDALLVRGTMLRCVLETRIISEADGFTSCILTEPVYSINGRSLLLPRGSKIYGTYKARPKGNRIEVVWDRVTTPNGIDVNMASPGVDPLGSAGYAGMLDSHWGTRITSAVMISLLSDAFKYAAAENGPSTATVSQGVVIQSPYESNTARTLDRLAHQAADEAMSRPPTVTINQGSLVSVYIARDVDFSEVLGR